MLYIDAIHFDTAYQLNSTDHLKLGGGYICAPDHPGRGHLASYNAFVQVCLMSLLV